MSRRRNGAAAGRRCWPHALIPAGWPPRALAASGGHGGEVLDLLIVLLGVVVVVWVFAYTIKCFVHPGESGGDHVKRRILQQKW